MGTTMRSKEILTLRTENGKVFQIGPQRYRSVTYFDTVHYLDKDTGEYRLIDNRFVPDGENLCNKDNPNLQVVLSPHRIALHNAKNEGLNWWLADAGDCSPKADEQKDQEELDQIHSSATYENILPHTDLKCELSGVHFKDELVFYTPEATKKAIFQLGINNLSFKQNESNILLIDESGETVFVLPPPVCTDCSSTAEPVQAAYKLEADDSGFWKLICTLPRDWLNSAVYPVTLDPIVVSYNAWCAIQDAYTCSKEPGTVHPGSYSNILRLTNSSNNWGHCRCFFKFTNNVLPSLDSSDYIIYGEFRVSTAQAGYPTSSFDGTVHEVTGNWSPSTLTHNNMPSYSNSILDYSTFQASEGEGHIHTFDITNLVRKWYAGTNNGLMLRANSSTYAQLRSSVFGQSDEHRPLVIIDYISKAGLEDYLAYEDHSAGRAGAGHVSLFNGNLIFEHNDTLTDGNLMPVSVSHVYNSSYNTINPFGTGYGWKLNVQQALRKETIAGTLYYVWVDEDGTEVYFAEENDVWKDQLGKELTLTFSNSEATIESKHGLKRIFALPTVEFNNNWNYAKPLLKTRNALDQEITLNGSGFARTSLTDGAGRSTLLSWDSSTLTQIRAPGMTAGISCQYSSNNLIKIIHEDLAETTYTYNNQHLLTQVQNPDGTTIQYTYSSNTPYRVLSVKISNSLSGTEQVAFHHTYSYLDALTIVTDILTGKSVRYHFNDSGNLIALTDDLGYGAFSEYTSSSPLNKPEALSKLQRSVVNLIRDPLFANAVWEQYTDNIGTFTYDTSVKYLGNQSMRLDRTSGTGMPNVYQTASLVKGTTYVLSAWCRTANDAKALLTAEMTADIGIITAYGREETSIDGWNRISLTFTLPANAASTIVTVRLNAAGSSGQVWFDGVQLEEGVTASRLNLIQNSDFRNGLTDWSTVSGISSGSVINAPTDSSRPPTLGTKTLCMTGGGYGQRVELFQVVFTPGNKGDVYVAGGWSKAGSVPRKGVKIKYCMRIMFHDGNSWQTDSADYVLWSEEWSGWHMAAIPITAPCDYTGIKIMLHYTNNYNTACFNGLFLHKEQFGQSFSYDQKGNLLSTTDLASLKDYAVYDKYNNLMEYRQPGRPASVSTRLSYGPTDQDKKMRLTKSIMTPLGMKTTYTHDIYGNVITTQIKRGILKMTTSAGYSSDGNYELSQTDARGNTVVKVINPNLGIVNSITDPKGQIFNYSYDILKRIVLIETTANNQIYHSLYTYTLDRLTQIKHNTSNNPSEDVTYLFEYDSLGRTTAIKVDTQVLSAISYNADGSTANITYGNNGQVRYGYDAFKRLTDVSFDTESSVRYHYTYGNNGEVAQTEDMTLGMIVRSEYDLANRPMRKTTLDTNGEVYMAEVAYDQYNNLASFKERVAGINTYSADYAYDTENKPTRISISNGTEIRYEYDNLGRVYKRIVLLGTNSLESTYTYVNGINGNTTTLIRRITQAGERTIYTYDETGDIVSVTYPDRQPEEEPSVLCLVTDENESLHASETAQIVTGFAPVYDDILSSANRIEDADENPVDYGLTSEQDTVSSIPLTGRTDGRQKNRISYKYDSLSQLIRVNDPFDPTASLQGTSWIYIYDQGGNILSKIAYAFTEEEAISGSAIHTDTYTYGNAHWKDQMTAYNGIPITYDAIGNPIADGEWTYVWQHGRQLAQMNKGEETICFIYNEDGLRIQKTATSTGTTKYILHGKDIVHLTNGQDELHFFYDAQGRIAVVEYNGIPYIYIHNLQGDVIALTDGNGNTVVEYCYDSWGKPVRKAGTMAATLGTIQPFRYRGYIWDEETGLYFLCSRYYCPTTARFVNTDFLISGNLYSYCCNNPIQMLDHEGSSSISYNYDNDLSIKLFKSFDDPITNQEFAAIITQMEYEQWKYAKAPNSYMRLGFVDCVSVYRYVIKWYYTLFSKIVPKGIDTVKGIVRKCCYNLEPIADDHHNLQIGMALFEKSKKKGYYHMGYYLGNGLILESNYIRNKKRKVIVDGVRIIPISETHFTECAYLNGIDYDFIVEGGA